MTEEFPDPPLEPYVPDPEKVARQRFFALAFIRFSGVFLVAFGFLIMLERYSWVQGEKAKALGAILAVAGIIQTIIVPRLLLRMFRTPR